MTPATLGWNTVYETDEGPADDRRWTLLAKLAHRAGTDAPAIRINARRRHRSFGFATGAPPELQDPLTLTIETDARVPLTFLVEELRGIWRRMKDGKTLPERSRPLEQRKLALLEFVCLEEPDAEWSERFERWNRRHRKWRYASRDAFTTACHDAEKQLTGSRSGLRWYYDPSARLSVAEVGRRAAAGDAAAKRELQRRSAEGLESIRDARIGEVVVEKGDQHGKTRKR